MDIEVETASLDRGLEEEQNMNVREREPEEDWSEEDMIDRMLE